MPEHHLVASEAEADFTLQPSLVSRNGDQVIRVDKMKEGQLLASSEREMMSINADRALAIAATEDALSKDTYVTADNLVPDTSTADDFGSDPSLRDANGSVSGATGDDMVSTEDMNQQGVANSDQPASQLQERGSESPAVSSTESQMENRDNPEVVGGAAAGAATGAAVAGGGESRAASPRPQVLDRPYYWQAGLGPAFPIGLNTDNIMYNVNGAFNYNYSESLTAKAFGDLNFSGGANSAQFTTLGVGAEIYPLQNITNMGRPYITGDVGYSFTRDANNNSQDAPQIGGGAGFKFNAKALAWDINLHYSILTSQINGNTPQVFAVRGSVNF
jgi:hypothetical protein